MSQDEHDATKLRQNKEVLNNLMATLQSINNDIKQSREKRQILQSALKVLIGIIAKGKCEDPNQDILKSPVISNGLIQAVKTLTKVDQAVQNSQLMTDLQADAIRAIGLLAKANFNRSVGIDLTFVKNFLQILPTLLYYPNGPSHSALQFEMLQINSTKTAGIFLNQMGMIPLRCLPTYKDILSLKVFSDLCSLLKVNNSGQNQQVIGLQKASIQALSVGLNPLQGETFQFPWKRSSNDFVKEYNDAFPVFENIRLAVLNYLQEFDWPACLVQIYKLCQEDSAKYSILRVLLQMARNSKDQVQYFFSEINTLLQSILYEQDPLLVSLSLQVISAIVKQATLLKQDINSLKLPLTQIFNLVESNYKNTETQIISIAACNVLCELLQHNDYQDLIIEKTSSLQFRSILVELLTRPKTSRQEEIKKIEGTNFGCIYMGYLDSVITLMYKVLSKLMAKQAAQEFINKLMEGTLPEVLVSLLSNLSPRSEISPRGLINLLAFIHDCLLHDCKSLMQKIFQEMIIRVLIGIFKEGQMKSIQEWPQFCGGGPASASLIVAQILKIFNLPYNMACYQKDLEKISSEFATTDIIQCTVQVLKHLKNDHLVIAVSILNRLVLLTDNEKPFAIQLVQIGGLKLFSQLELLDANQSNILIIDTLSLFSQLARLSKDFYEPIHQSNIYANLKKLLDHKEPQVRAKACNLVGNICRYSAFFYDALIQYGLIVSAINCCRDQDKNTRKFACFAVGNAAFHNDKLYEHLRPCVPMLVDLLTDQEEKTRANAAGALGNFVRNSDGLCGDLIKYGALQQLLNLVKSDQGPSQSPRQVALFSIGNLSVYASCRAEFERLGIKQIIENLLQHRDQAVVKYATRILQKLRNPPDI